MATDTYSPNEVESMRDIVLQHDRETKPKVIDINNPPKEPYVFRPFPKMVYDHRKSSPSQIKFKAGRNGDQLEEHIDAKLAWRVVKNQDELDAALAAGYSTEVPAQHPAIEEETDNEAPRRRKRGE